MKIRRLFFLCPFCLLLFSNAAFSQSKLQKQIDSLDQIIQHTKDQDSLLSLLSTQLSLVKQTDDLKKQALVEMALGNASDYEGVAMESHHKNALAIYKTIADTFGIINAYYELAEAKLLQNNYDSTRIYAEEVVALSLVDKDTVSLIKGRLMLASVYNHLALYTEALKELNQGKILAESTPDNETVLIDILNRESFIFYSLGEYDKSAEDISRILEILKPKGNARSLNIWSNNLASVYSLCNCVSYEKRKSILKQSIAYAEEANFPYGKAFAYKHLADVHKDAGQLDSSKVYLDKIEKLLPQINKKDFTALVSIAQAVYWRKNGNRDNAIQYFTKAYNIWEEIGKQKEQMEIAGNLSSLYEEKGNFTQAYKYMHTYVSLKDSLYSEDNIRNIKELEMTYDFRQKQITDSLRNQEQLNRLAYEASFQKRTKNLLFIGVFVVLIVAIIVYKSLVSQRKLSRLLAIKSEEVENELNAKKLLLTEIHHRVKNNFQILSSLLELQARGTDDQATRDLISEGKSRVKSMALIHNQLYNTDSLKVKLLDYLKNLVTEVQKSFVGHESEVDYDVNPDYDVDVDNMVPLGLIANELITNAYKYAGSVNLKLTISLYTDGNYKVLEFKDNGPGLPNSFDLTQTKTTGIWLISRLAMQLHGRYEYEFQEGAVFKIYFSQSEFVEA